MDRKLFKLPFRKNKTPEWICPTCKKGVLHIKEGTFHSAERSLSKKAHSHEAWEPEWIEYAYSCLFECSNNSCQEIVANTGIGSVDWEGSYDEHGEPCQDWYDFYRPKHFEPHLNLFDYPDNTPEEVAEEIDQSFTLFFSNPASASNHLRVALENLLTHLKIKQQETKNGKRFFLNLHKRIELVPAKYEGIKDLLLAVKWLGNAGSHAKKTITSDDVMDAYEIMDVVLKEVFDKGHSHARALAKKINKKKGPK